jgi:DNA-nicking Smr family endonuclease
VTSLDRRLRQRLNRGHAGIDGRVDLHGLTQAQAHDALVGFLRTARAEGARIVLVITGKGTRGADSERGVLRRQVPFWLRSPQLRDVVLGFETAGPAHGGEGAFYVLLRRARS